MYLFDESLGTLLTRMDGLNVPLRKHVESGLVSIRQIDPAEVTPGEFAHSIQVEVEKNDAACVVIDSLNGYLNAMPGERYLTIHLHELLMYLGERNVASLLIGAHQGLIGANMQTPVDASYLADAVILMRYYEARGEVHQAISVMKKRGGDHERTIRKFSMRPGGVHVGEPLREMRGILTGVPMYSNAPPSGN
jgi:circadian clock protein KaiC